MDPNACLAEIREAIRAHQTDQDIDAHSLLEHLAAHVEAMDEWLSRGGFLPGAWHTTMRDSYPPVR